MAVYIRNTLEVNKILYASERIAINLELLFNIF